MQGPSVSFLVLIDRSNSIYNLFCLRPKRVNGATSCKTTMTARHVTPGSQWILYEKIDPSPDVVEDVEYLNDKGAFPGRCD